jgi:hypothetical protein
MNTCPRLYQVAMVALAGLSLMALTRRPAQLEPTPAPTPTAGAGEEVLAPTEIGPPAAPAASARPARPRASSRLPFSYDVEQVAALNRAGVAPSVIAAYVEHSPTVAPANAAEIIYLHESGLPAEILVAFLRRGSDRPAESVQTPAASQPAMATALPPPPSVPVRPAQAAILPAPVAAAPTYLTYPVYVYQPAPVTTFLRPTFYRPFPTYSYRCGHRVAPFVRPGCVPLAGFSGSYGWARSGSYYRSGLVMHQPRVGIHFPHR